MVSVIFVIVQVIGYLTEILVFIIFIDALLSFFLHPANPLRNALDRIVNPMLAPIRRVVPPLGGLDLSPLILIILIEIVSRVLISLVSLL